MGVSEVGNPPARGVVSGRARRGRAAAVAVCLLLASAALFVALRAAVGSGRGEYKRFVSAPLPDGTRYTFLYPAHLGVVQAYPSPGAPAASEKGAVTLLAAGGPGQPPPGWNPLLWELRWQASRRAPRLFSIPQDFLQVHVRRQHRPDPDGPRHGRWVNGKAELQHELFVVAGHRPSRLTLEHRTEFRSPRAAADFRRHDAVISDSLRFLRPGEEPPVE